MGTWSNFKYLKKKFQNTGSQNLTGKNKKKKINKFSNFTTKVEGINIHFIKEKGSGNNAIPLLILHGWPGSIVEFLNIIDENLLILRNLVEKKEDAFDVKIAQNSWFWFFRFI